MERRDLAYIRLAGYALITLVAIHGATSKEWRDLHSIGVLLSALAVIGNEIL